MSNHRIKTLYGYFFVSYIKKIDFLENWCVILSFSHHDINGVLT